VKARGRGIARSDAILLVAAATVALSVALAVVSPRGGNLDDRARAIEAQLRCPTCQGLSIADSPATSAAQMRSVIREQLAAGSSDDDIRAFFVARYGRWILLDPPASGPDLALWLAPAAILVAGALLVVRHARSRDETGSARRWSALAPLPTPRFSTLALGTAMALALAVPIVAAVGPRLAGREVSGGEVSQAAPSIEDLEAFVGAEPADVGALVALGDALLAANRTAEAADRYKAALDLDPNNLGALLGVGTILLAADRPDAAGPVFDRILALSPDQPDALLYRAVARRRLNGRITDEVRRDVERFLLVTSASDPRRVMASGLLEPPATPLPGSSVAPSRTPTLP
jgi:cytochrome c-type biogenesis protein CcmH